MLDVGAGTGRVALRLAYAGHDVTALDLDPELLRRARAARRRGRLTVKTLAADANDFTLPEPVGLVAVPMQTIQLLRDARRLLRLRPPRAQARRAASRWRSPPTSSPTTARRRCPRPDLGAGRRLDLHLPADRDPRRRASSVAIERIRQRIGPRRRARRRPTT